MGNFEKLVVLTVLFLSAIVLAISLNDDDKKAEQASPLERVRSAGAAPSAQAEPTGRSPKTGEGAGTGILLSTEVLPDAARAEPAAAPALPPARDGRQPILRETAGLRRAGLDDYMVTTAGAEDTWTGLSERFYGSGRYVSLLRHANEDMVSPIAGETILVPVYDFASEAGRRAPLAPEETTLAALAPDRPAGEQPARPAPSERRAPATLGADLTAATRVTVGAGDSLSGIALRVYGSASRWNVLYEANRGLLKSPDWLQVGTELVVPRGAELQELAQRLAASAAATPRASDEAVERKGKVR